MATSRITAAPLLVWAVVSLGCGEQAPEVAVRVYALDAAVATDAGKDANTQSPPQCNPQTLALYSLLSSIQEDCEIPISNSMWRESIVSWLSERHPRQAEPGEPGYLDVCHVPIDQPPHVVYTNSEDKLYVCPVYCVEALTWVRENEQEVLRCYDASAGN